MYVPGDLSRYCRQTPAQFQQLMNSSIFPVQSTDPNSIFRLEDSQFGFDVLDTTYTLDCCIRVSRTPLLSTDPRTYANVSRFVEYELRRWHTTMGNAAQNKLDETTPLPPEMVGVQPDGRSEILPFGCSINPLAADPFRNVQLTPGCFTQLVEFAQPSANAPHSGFNSTSRWFKQRPKGVSGTAADSLKLPRSNMMRTSSNFVDRVVQGDSYNKKSANCRKLLVSCNGRALNVISLEDDPKKIDVDPPLLRMFIHTSTVTALDTFAYVTSSSEKNVDVLVGFSSGDILWFNPLRMKYSRWNKNGCMHKSPVMSIQWSKNGSFATAGFADGEVLVFKRGLEDDPSYTGSLPTRKPIYKDRLMRTYSSMMGEKVANPVAHYKFSDKAITRIAAHPLYNNIVAIACEDGNLLLFDFLREKVTDRQESYYAGFLEAEFTEDGKYLIAGGEDDLVSIYEFQGTSIYGGSDEGYIRLVARLQGSESWIRGVKVDTYLSQSGLLYRIGVVGDDSAIRFFEFQPRSLPKIKKKVGAAGTGGAGVRRNSSLVTTTTRHRVSSITSDRAPSSTSVSASALHRESSATANSSSMRRVLSGNKHPKNSDSISSLTSSVTQQHPLSLLEMISQGSAGSIQAQAQAQAQTQSKSQSNLDQDFLDRFVSKNSLFSQQPAGTWLQTSPGWCLHPSIGIRDCPTIYSIGHKKTDLGRMSGLHFEEKYVWAFVATGELVRWKRPTQPSATI